MSARALVLWAEPASTNLGVRALAEGTARLVRRAVPDADIEFQGYGPGDAPVRLGMPRAYAHRLLAPRDVLVDYIRSFDLVVDTRAGDSFTDIYGMQRLWVMSLMAATVVRAGVPLVLGPQTIGPFRTRRGRGLARLTLRASGVVMARDSMSARAAERLGRPVDVTTTDVVFALPTPTVDQTRDVVVNPSGLLWHPNPHMDAATYRQVLRQLIRRLKERGRSVSVLAHVLDSPLVDNDVPVVRQLAQEFDVEPVVPADLHDARAILASSRLVVGSRMHACLNALSVGTPAIPLAYSRKFKPLLDEIGWPFTIDPRADADAVDHVLNAADDHALGSRVASVREHAELTMDAAVSELTRVS